MAARVGIYLRLSREDGRNGEANSIAGQRRDCLAYAESRGWIVTEFVDEGISASKGLDRPAYRAMLDAMAAGELDHIVAAKQDRYTRDRDVEWGQLVKLAAEFGVQVHTADSGQLRLDTPDGALAAGIRSEFSAFEARIIAARTRRGLQTRREAGEWASHGRTYGYLPGGMVNQEQARHVQWAYDAILNRGMTLRQVFDTWRRDGVFTVRGNQWSSVDRVAAMLRNPVLAGLVVHRGEIIGRGTWQAIVTPEERERLSAAIAANTRGSRGYGQRRPRRHWLAGLMLCGNPSCDLKVMTSHSPGRDRGYFYWTCDRRRGGCGNRVRSDELSLPVTFAAQYFLTGTKAPELTAPAFDAGPKREIEQQIVEIREALAARQMRAADAIPVLNQLRAELAEQEAAREAFERERETVESWHEVQFAAVWTGDPESLRSLIDNIRVLPDRAGFVFEGRNGATHMVQRRADGSMVGYTPKDGGAETIWNPFTYSPDD